MRYYIDLKTNRLIDREGELSDIHLDDAVDFNKLCNHLNAKEIEKLEYNNLRFKVRKLSENI